MTADQWTTLILGILAGVAAVLTAAATVIQSLRTHHEIERLGRGLNGRLDALLAEREARVRAEAAIETERLRASNLGTLGGSQRPEPIVERRPPDEPR